jgi:hypothetical protein
MSLCSFDDGVRHGVVRMLGDHGPRHRGVEGGVSKDGAAPIRSSDLRMTNATGLHLMLATSER